jgi:hypothetical protein
MGLLSPLRADVLSLAGDGRPRPHPRKEESWLT